MCAAPQLLDDAAAQAIDCLYIAELPRAEADNLSRLETAMKEQVGHSLFARVVEHLLEYFPHLITVNIFFQEWLSRKTRRWECYFSVPRVVPQCIQNGTIQTRT